MAGPHNALSERMSLKFRNNLAHVSIVPDSTKKNYTSGECVALRRGSEWGQCGGGGIFRKPLFCRISVFNLYTAVFFSLQSLCLMHTGNPTGVAVSHCTCFQTQPIPTACQIRYHNHLWIIVALDHSEPGFRDVVSSTVW